MTIYITELVTGLLVFDTRPLRAAMIVFLMMQDANNA